MARPPAGPRSGPSLTRAVHVGDLVEVASAVVRPKRLEEPETSSAWPLLSSSTSTSRAWRSCQADSAPSLPCRAQCDVSGAATGSKARSRWTAVTSASWQPAAHSTSPTRVKPIIHHPSSSHHPPSIIIVLLEEVEIDRANGANLPRWMFAEARLQPRPGPSIKPCPWTCSGSRRRERAPLEPPRRAPLPRGCRWRAACCLRGWR